MRRLSTPEVDFLLNSSVFSVLLLGHIISILIESASCDSAVKVFLVSVNLAAKQ
jgi:hypothetical protein